MAEIKETAARETRGAVTGRAEHAPFTIFGGVAVFVMAVAAVVIAIALVLWLVF
jgi:hypothetical protein